MKTNSLYTIALTVCLLGFSLAASAYERAPRKISVAEACAICDTLPEAVPTTEVYDLEAVISGINHANQKLEGLLNVELMDSTHFLFSYHQASLDSVMYTKDEVLHYGDTIILRTRLEKFGGSPCAYKGYTVRLMHFVDPTLKLKEKEYMWAMARQRNHYFLGAASFIVLVMLLGGLVYYRKMVYRIEHDFLTGVYNRDGGYKRMMVHLKKEHHGFFAIMDVDHFKHVNDTYGHVVGDELLVRVAKAMRESFSGNLVMRLGGDEFAIFFKGESDEQAFRLAVDHFFDNLDSIHLLSAPDYRVTVSIGATYYGDGDADSFDQLYSRADQRLYESKAVKNSSLCIEKATV